MTLKVVEPINVTEAVLTASDIPEPDVSQGEVEWESDRFAGIGNIPTGSDRGCYSVVRDGIGYLVSRAPNSGFGTSFIYGVDENLSYDGTSVEFNTGRIVDFVKVANFFLSTLTNAIVEYDASGSFVTSYDISTEVSRSSGICFDGLNYYVLDLDSSRVFKYSSSFVYLGVSFEIASGTGYAGALTFDNGVIHYVDRINGEAVGVDTLGEEIYRVGISGIQEEVSNLWCVTRSGDSNFLVTSTNTTTIYLCDDSYDYLALYQPGDRVILTDEHKVYQCLSKTRENPSLGATEDATATWIVVGPTNKWAMFDDQNSTTTKSIGSFSLELESSNYIMAYGVTGSSGLTSVRCQVYDSGDNIVYDDTQSAFDTVGAPGDFIYASEDVFYKKRLYQTDIPPTENFRAVFTFNGSDIEIGNLTVGPAIELGPCLSDSKNESLDLSEQTFDDFGNETYIERPIITFATYETISSIENSNIINRFLNVIRRKGCLWIGEVGYNQSIVTFGRIERDPIPYTMPTEIRYTIRVRGFA